VPDNELSIIVRMRDFATQELARVRRSFGQFSSDVTGIFGGLSRSVFSFKGILAGVGVAIGVKETLGAIIDTAGKADKLGDLSLQLGVSTEALSELEFAAGQSGASLEDLEAGFRNLQKSVGELRLGGGEGAHKLFSLLSEDFQRMVEEGAGAEQLFGQLSVEFRGLGDAEKVFVASKLFGKSGTRLIPLLSEDIDELREMASKLGLTLSRDAARAADAFGDSLGKLKGAFQGLKQQVILPLLPELTKGLEFLTKLVRENRPAIINFFADLVESGGEAARTFAGLIVQVEAAIGPLARMATRLEILKLTAGGLFDKFAGALPGETFEQTQRRGNALIQEAAALSDELGRHAEERKRILDGLSKAFEENTKAAATRIRALAAELQAVQDFVGPPLPRGFGPFGPEQFVGPPLPPGFGPQEPLLDIEDPREERVNRLAEAERRRADALERHETAAHEKWMQEHDAILGVSAALDQLADNSTKWGLAFGSAVGQVTDVLANDTVDALLAVQEGTVKGREAFRRFARAVLADIQRIILRLIIVKILEAGIGALGGLFKGGVAQDYPTTVGLPGGTTVTPERLGGIVPGHLIPIAGHAQEGTIARRRGLYELAETGQAELVVPLAGNRDVPVRLVGSRPSGGREDLRAMLQVVVHFHSHALSSAEERSMLERNARIIGGIVVQEANSKLAVREGLAA